LGGKKREKGDVDRGIRAGGAGGWAYGSRGRGGGLQDVFRKWDLEVKISRIAWPLPHS